MANWVVFWKPEVKLCWLWKVQDFITKLLSYFRNKMCTCFLSEKNGQYGLTFDCFFLVHWNCWYGATSLFDDMFRWFHGGFFFDVTTTEGLTVPRRRVCWPSWMARVGIIVVVLACADNPSPCFDTVKSKLVHLLFRWMVKCRMCCPC